MSKYLSAVLVYCIFHTNSEVELSSAWAQEKIVILNCPCAVMKRLDQTTESQLLCNTGLAKLHFLN